eukprot:CAMPEP_0170221260 /NCGR_PEP_ID=MMETSP0116_2-20130129/10317_1 /TAXON_ID=400756 /ORGANISM="Durinskia baltica, Strain CSIRO CS-38" /LENGTH=238 /DNA_ID=CAMNT_0010471937 /DNA_START=68 /DNA_END=780 /DNA_ORIENTATION=+
MAPAATPQEEVKLSVVAPAPRQPDDAGVGAAEDPTSRRRKLGAILGTAALAAMAFMAAVASWSAGQEDVDSAAMPRSLAPQNNPFKDVPYYVNPTYAASLDSSLASAESLVSETLQSMKVVPSAYWLDVKTKIEGTGTKSMEGILADAASRPNPELVTFIVYDLPNRDCHAKASNGEICCTYLADGRCDYSAAGMCESGIAEYKAEYIDKIVGVLQKYDGKVPIVLVIEPDSLPNLST